MTDTAATFQNYILYRTTALTRQPASYTGPDGKTVTPGLETLSPAGCVIATQVLSGLDGIMVPDGFAYALDAAGKYPAGSVYTSSTGYTLTGPSTGAAGTALTLTLTPDNDGPVSDTVVTLADGGAGGTFSADTVTFNGCTNTARTLTYTPKAAGTVTISATNGDGLANPASLSVTVAATS